MPPSRSERSTDRRCPRRRGVLLALLAAPCALWLSSAAAEEPPPFVVIVHPSNPVTSATRAFLTDAFLKKTTRWSHDEPIRPADLRPSSATRAVFSRKVLGRSVAAVRSYWQQRIFSGRGVPPPELDDDAAVVRYVLTHSGSVGYVSGRARLDGARVIAVE